MRSMVLATYNSVSVCTKVSVVSAYVMSYVAAALYSQDEVYQGVRQQVFKGEKYLQTQILLYQGVETFVVISYAAA